MASVDNGAWDGPAAMSACAQSDDPAAAYEAICAGRRDGDPALQSTWALPHHSHPGDPPNAAGVRNSLSRLPQTDGLTNAQAAERHLQAHLEDIQQAEGRSEEPEEVVDELYVVAARSVVLDAEVQVRDESKREIEMRLLPWGKQIDTILGPEEFRPGAFSDIKASDTYLYGAGHEARMGIGQDGKPVLTRVPVGRGVSLSDHPDGPRAVYRVAQTSAGDEQLALARDGIVTGVSVEFAQVPGGTV